MNINAWLSLQVITSQQAAGTSMERLRTEAHVIERHNVRLERREKTPAETLGAEVTSTLYLYTHLKPSHTVHKAEVLDILVHLTHWTVCHWLHAEFQLLFSISHVPSVRARRPVKKRSMSATSRQQKVLWGHCRVLGVQLNCLHHGSHHDCKPYKHWWHKWSLTSPMHPDMETMQHSRPSCFSQSQLFLLNLFCCNENKVTSAKSTFFYYELLYNLCILFVH